MNATPEPPMHTGPFRDPLANWPNDDLLIRDESRESLLRTYPDRLRVLDWPELRDAFVRHDVPAERNKQASHRQGLLAIAFAGLGVVLLGLVPALPHAAEAALATVALLFMSIGGGLGMMHWVVLRSRFAWLGHRFWAERLRQLYFQSLVNTLDLTAAAMTNDTALAELRQRRAIWLTEFYADPADPRDRLREIADDHTEAKTWLRSDWKHYVRPESSDVELQSLLDALCHQRIHIQHTYAARNLGPDIYASPTRARILHAIGDGSAMLVVFAAVAGWLAHLVGSQVLGLDALVWTSIAAVLSATGLMARAADQGLQNEADAERFEWYADAVSKVEERYEGAAIDGRVAELRRLEELAYQELRRFLRTHDAARFTM